MAIPRCARRARRAGEWLLYLLLFSGLTGCGDPHVRAKKRLAGLTICSGYSEERALVQDTKSLRFGYIDRQGEIVIPVRFSDGRMFSEGLAAVRQARSGLYGFLDPQGRLIIPHAYQAAFPFSEGMAAVTLRGKQGFIDKSGVLRIPAKFDRVFAFSEGRAQVIDRGLAGFVDVQGSLVIPPAYFKAGSFHDGLARVCSRDKCGFLNKAGQVAIPIAYDDAGDFASGFAPARVGGKWGFLDAQGKWLVEPSFDTAQPFRDGLALVGRRVASQPDRGYGGYSGPTTVYGYLDRQGKSVIEPSIRRASSFAEGVARIEVPAGQWMCSDCYATAYLKKDGSLIGRFRSGGEFQGGVAVVAGEGPAGEAGFLIDASGVALFEFDRARPVEPDRWTTGVSHIRYGYIGPNGDVAIPHTLSSAEPFSEGLGLVRKRDDRRSSRLCYIDKTGAVKLEAPAAAGLAQPFSNGLALLTFNAGRSKGARHAYMDKSGDLQIEGDFAEAQPFSEGLAAVKTTPQHGANNWGYLNVRGEMVIPARFSAAAPFRKGLATVSIIQENVISGGAIDRTGKIVVPAFFPEDLPRDPWFSLRMFSRLDAPRDLIPVYTREGFAYLTREGRMAIRNPSYGKGGEFSEGLAAVFVADTPGTGSWGYVDRSGKLVIAARFLEARHFSAGLARVQDECGRYGYINREGRWAIPPMFLEEAHDFQEGLALVKLNGFYGFLDRKGGFAIRASYPRASGFSEGLAVTAVAQ